MSSRNVHHARIAASAGAGIGLVLGVPCLGLSFVAQERLPWLAASVLFVVGGAAVGRLWARLSRPSGALATGGVVLGVAVTATLVGAAVVATAAATPMVVATLRHPVAYQLLDGIGTFVVFWGLGVIILGIPSMVLTLPLAGLWLLLVRHLHSHHSFES